MDNFRKYREQNRRLWDEITPLHYEHPDYKVAEFLGGENIIYDLMLEEIGDVRGKDMLHLMCHFGLEPLSLARMGANVTGIDFSQEAIRYARSLAESAKLDARFIESDIYDSPLQCDALFDIVYSTIGVLCWLNDLDAWAGIIARFLKPGGFFYLLEDHPIALMVSDDWEEGDIYFHKEEPVEWPGSADYSDPSYKRKNSAFEWSWSIGDVISAVAGAGLRIDFYHEFPFALHKSRTDFEERDGKWWLPGKEDLIPLTFSLKATRVE
jgi:SAM-dependent methyltransferase